MTEITTPQITVSVIIPFKALNGYVHETLSHLARMDCGNFEVILLPDELFTHDELGIRAERNEDSLSSDSIQIVPTGPCGPAAKRDLALTRARGEILAFLDDDTYPCPTWLTNAIRYFTDQSVAAVGGPAITPPSDGLMQRASGYVYESLLGGGPYAYRYVEDKIRQVDDYPTCNLLVRRSVFEELGGFDTAFWPGEDTKLCLDITRKLGLKILYAPDVVVCHHRRPLFRPHLRQAREYALHRGYFAKRFPATSLRPSYFLPTSLVAGLVAGALAAVTVPSTSRFYLAILACYALSNVVSSAIASRSLKLTLLVTAGTIATHVVYGIYFMRGLISKRLPEEDRTLDALSVGEA